MITEQDLREAIAECQGVRNPTSSTCIKLASYLTLLEHLYPQKEEIKLPEPTYSFAAEPVEKPIMIHSDSEFAQAINGRQQDEIWPIMDELADALQALNPRLYASLMRKLK